MTSGDQNDWDWTPRPDDDVRHGIASLARLRRVLRDLAQEAGSDLESEDGRGRLDSLDRLRNEFGDRGARVIEVARDISRLAAGLNSCLGSPGQRGIKDAGAGPCKSYARASLFTGRKPVLRGFIERYLVFSASPPLSDELVARLILAIPGERDVLIGENHQFGWHYHYCDKAERRSDVIMSFDSRTTKPLGRTAVHPLRWEPHAVNKAKFQARPYNWKDAKRSNIYSACAGDLRTKRIADFKTPSQNAKDVWP